MTSSPAGVSARRLLPVRLVPTNVYSLRVAEETVRPDSEIGVTEKILLVDVLK